MFWWWPEVFEPIGGPIAQRQLGLHWSRVYDVVPCKRGFCMVSPSAGGVPDLLAWMAEHGFVPEPVDLTDIRALGNSLMGALRGFALQLDATEVFDGGQARHVPFGEVLTIPQVSESPQHAARQLLPPRRRHPRRRARPVRPLLRDPVPAAAGAPGRGRSPGRQLDELLDEWAATSPSAAEPGGDPAALPLAGVRVVDFTHVLAGPFATRVLADLGAEVLKVQTDVRAQGAHGNAYPYFAMWNRSKSSITLNMGDERAGAVLRRLVEAVRRCGRELLRRRARRVGRWLVRPVVVERADHLPVDARRR